MEPFTRFTATALPLEQANVDTDQVIPARFMGKPLPQVGAWAFYDLRYDASGAQRPGCPFNDPAYRGASILVARENFGCGSSREHAVWALTNSRDLTRDYAFRCVVAPSFGEIFYSNACKNGLLPVVLPTPVVEQILAHLRREPARPMTVDLERQVVVAPDGIEHGFEFDAFQKDCLLRGIDDIDVTLALEDKIIEFERQRSTATPWLD
ncbi:MAG: 3-isopropylmalate dehydratase small subunit [Deltaproteobacteria bacterium]|nr:3-isopropylmalate dehydratase small subunit [Deltaproteobacteria bacterium]